MTTTSSDFNNIAKAISAYTEAKRTDSALLLSTALVGTEASITDAGENYTGTLRFLDFTDPATAHKQSETITDTNINLLAVTNSADVYVKNIDHVAAQEMSVQRLISKVDGLAFLGSKFAAVKARKEDLQLRSILGGVADLAWGAEVLGVSDAAGVVGTFGYRMGTTAGSAINPLFVQETSANNRSAFFDVLFDAMTAIGGEFEEPFYYFVIDTATYNILRKQNVLDAGVAADGNYNFSTILGGKIRLVINNQNVLTNLTATVKVSYLATAGAFHYSDVSQVNPTAIDRNELAGNGGGAVTILSRWGNIMHPKGYSWAGSATAYPTNAVLSDKASWTLTATNVNQTGIFPIFHG